MDEMGLWGDVYFVGLYVDALVRIRVVIHGQ